MVSQWYDLVIFTASMEIYGAAVAEKLDANRGLLNRRYYRQVGSCIVVVVIVCSWLCWSFSLLVYLLLLAYDNLKVDYKTI